ncbi:hypothetical protein NDU88_002246 [Pleurodeles waltl]|uniref:Uncharacterized protein n=1 Tax=Pleurodeles waltl TaxID=8319 RepID=A0AAV7VDS2_PLEWA|nr:hypothetical protein NDU88_002246 [Pleurodeles waltl]
MEVGSPEEAENRGCWWPAPWHAVTPSHTESRASTWGSDQVPLQRKRTLERLGLADARIESWGITIQGDRESSGSDGTTGFAGIWSGNISPKYEEHIYETELVVARSNIVRPQADK